MSTTTNDLSHWPVKVTGIPVAWGDMDAYGHVNNTVYLRWFETARIAYFEAIGLGTSGPGNADAIGPILARATCDYRLPVAYPDTIDAWATVTHIGRTSFVMNYQVRSHAHKHAIAASGEGVVVMYDYQAAAKAPVSDTLRAAIETLESRE